MRDNIDVFFLKQAYLYAERAICVRRKVGCVVARNGLILSGGYNGAVSKIEHCTEKTCIRNKLKIPSGERDDLCFGAHAEINALVQAAKNGVNINKATLYCTTKPCLYCAKAIVNAGIVRVVYCEEYGKEDELFNKILSNIKVDIIKI